MAKEEKETIFTPKRTVKFFFVNLIGMGLVAMVVWPLMDMIFDNVWNGGYDGWTWETGILGPWIFAVVITVLEFVFWNFFHPNKDGKDTRKTDK